VVDAGESVGADKEMSMRAETLAKAFVLTHGVRFTPEALQRAAQVNAKRQNGVYNLPAADPEAGRVGNPHLALLSANERLERPQELFLVGDDGYTVCVSAVAPVQGREPATVDWRDGRLTLCTPSQPKIGQRLAGVNYVPQPAYYDLLTAAGRPVQRWVSACGYDEMNVWPWHDCAIGRACSFCGINTVQKEAGRSVDLLHALELRREPDAERFWLSARAAVLAEITEAVGLSINDECYRNEIHLILISGNLADHQLDAQAKIYSDIALAITRQHPGRFAEGVVAVTAPPRDPGLLLVMRESGVEIGVFNLEAFSPGAFARYCPGKDRIGRDHYLMTLMRGVEVFGWGKSWCNFVLGLEPASDLLAGCEELAARGVTPGANVLHRDHGASGLHDPPDIATVLTFYRELSNIYRRHNHQPYYCQRALRTSLANEAFAGRLD
jgi:hypothetical protein